MAREILEHFPRLSRFYGLSPAELASTPNTILSLYLDAIPALRAEEQKAAFEASSYPHAKPGQQKSATRPLDRAIKRYERDVRRRRKGKKDAPDPNWRQQLAGIGVEVVEVTDA